ncbi:MAG TPA: GtrA family protein [Actinoplanes sp.]|nr:GtrA family protein [Actinoplanes sp.]
MRNAELRRLARYGISGGASALTHFSVLFVLVEAAHVWPPAASTAGFVASIVVSYLLQRAWVFRSETRHAVAGTRFLTVTAVAFGINTGIVWAGFEVLHLPYGWVQVVALTAIPVVNYTLNSRWTFKAHPTTPGPEVNRPLHRQTDKAGTERAGGP